MTWLTSRQFRLSAVGAVAAFIVIGAVLAYTGPHLTHLYDASGIKQCQATRGDCSVLVEDFTSHYPWLHILDPMIMIIPGLVGVFWGAPLLSRELETGTYRLAWTQSVTRTRWLATKVAVVGTASIVVTGAFSVIVAVWSSPLDSADGNRFNPGTFSVRGIVPLGYAAFAFALGLVAGAVIKRLLPAMTATLAGFSGVRFAFQQWGRSHLATPLHVTTALFASHHNSPANGATTKVHPNDWIVSVHTINAAGHTVAINRDTLRSICKLPEGDFSQSSIQACAQTFHLHSVLTVQPASRYWPFQAGETAIFTVLAAALTALSFWWTRRRIT